MKKRIRPTMAMIAREKKIAEIWRTRFANMTLHFNNLLGDLIVKWRPFIGSQSCDTEILGNLHAGDKIAIFGTVTKVEESYCYENGGKSSKIEYMVEETRRIKI